MATTPTIEDRHQSHRSVFYVLSLLHSGYYTPAEEIWIGEGARARLRGKVAPAYTQPRAIACARLGYYLMDKACKVTVAAVEVKS